MQITILVDADAVALAMSEAGNRYQNATAYVQAVVDQFLAPLVTRTVQTRDAQLLHAYHDAPPVVQETVRETLGV